MQKIVPHEDRLIVSPSNVKFQAPFPHNQKRQLSLLNLNGRAVYYKIELDEDSLFSVLPSRGSVEPFDTIELTIFMRPAMVEQGGISLSVQYVSKNDVGSAGKDDVYPDEEDWKQALTSPVNISLENYMENGTELMRVFGVNSEKEMDNGNEEQYKPICNKCLVKQAKSFVCNTKCCLWRRRLLWSFLVLLFAVAGDRQYITMNILYLNNVTSPPSYLTQSDRCILSSRRRLTRISTKQVLRINYWIMQIETVPPAAKPNTGFTPLSYSLPPSHAAAPMPVKSIIRAVGCGFKSTCRLSGWLTQLPFAPRTCTHIHIHLQTHLHTHHRWVRAPLLCGLIYKAIIATIKF